MHNYFFQNLYEISSPGPLGYDAVKVKVVWTSKSLVSYHITQSHNPEDLN
jgi:hypothetical protein